MPPSLSSSTAAASSSSNRAHRRVILLLDLDCFYAQCECIRLGLDATVTPLALMQWNSALAVTYPARERFDIKRGDGWDCIHKKSLSSKQQQQHQQQNQNDEKSSSKNDNNNSKSNNGTFDKCLTVHVPIMTTNDDSTDKNNKNADGAADHHDHDIIDTTDTIQDEYNRIFVLTPDEQERCRLQDIGVRKLQHQGKASIERYRIASARIFTTVLEYCQENFDNGSIILERASIDEFFLDITRAVVSSSSSSALDTEDSFTNVRQETVIVGQEQNERNPDERGDDDAADDVDHEEEDDIEHVQALWRGCAIAHGIRKAVRQQLGFTLSAGIGPNKSIAKLSASYGKPNGQAMTLPKHVTTLLNQTQISSCRNLGGKRGKQIQALLPSNVPTTVGSITRYLSLPDLQHKLAAQSGASNGSNNSNGTAEQAHALAVWVYNLARGIDTEPVVSKNESALLTKSLTAYKALPHNNNQGHCLADAKPWIVLLAKELVNRVERDAARHSRYPKHCTIHYDVIVASTAASSQSSSRKSWRNNSTGRTIRMSFPLARLSTQQKIQELCNKPILLIGNKEQNQDNHLRISRIGLCAVDFLVRDVSTRSIDSYFQTSSATTISTASATAVTINNNTMMTATNKNDTSCTVVPNLDNDNNNEAVAEDIMPEPPAGEMLSQTAATRSTAATRTSPATARTSKSSSSSKAINTLVSDLELAKKMQKQFDREHRVLEAMDAGMKKITKKKTRRGSTSSTSQPDQKTRRIDSFFSKR